MEINTKRLTKRVSLGLIIGYAIIFALYHIINNLYYNVILDIIWSFINKITYLFPIFISATITLVIYLIVGKKQAYLSLIAFSLTRMIFFIPYFYLSYIIEWYDSIEAIIYGTLKALGEAAIAYGITLLFLALMLFVIKKRNKSNISADLILKDTKLDFTDPISLSLAILSLIGFSYYFIIDTIEIISLLFNNFGNITPDIVLYIIFTFVFDFALIFIYYFTLSFLKNKIV